MSDSTNLHNPVLESGVIGACLTSPDALSETIGAGVQSADFHTPAHRLIWDAITALNDAGGAVDMPLVFNRLVREGNAEAAGGPDAILGHAQESVVTPDRIGEYVLELRTLSVQRKLLEFGADAQKAGSDTLDVAGEISRLTDELAALQAAADIQGHDITIGAAIGQVLDWAEEVETSGGALLGPSFTLPDLDKLTRGLRRTEITLIAARPAMGKSLVAGQLALEAARGGYKTAFVSLEMSQLDLGKRFMSAEARMPTDKMEQGTMDDREWQMISKAAARLDVLPMMIIDDAMTFGEIAARIERAERELDGLDLIIVDYLQLVELGERVESRQQEVSTVSRRLKLLAKKKNCAVLALSQLSRKVEERQDRRPILSDLRESGALEQDAAAVVFLYRDEVYNPDSPDVGIIEFGLAKNRHGPIGIVSASFIPQHSMFKPLERRLAPPDPGGAF